MKVFLYSRDLMIFSPVSAAAGAVGLTVRSISNTQDLRENITESEPCLLLIDLNVPGINPQELISEIKSRSNDSVAVAFGPHVHTKLLEEARQAGCDMVVTRGEFHARMKNIIERYAAA